MDDLSQPRATPPEAQSEGESDAGGQRGFFGRLIEALTATDSPLDGAGTSPQQVAASVAGLLSLRRMRVEEVMIPKVDVIAVPVTTDKDDLVGIFRKSGLTRLPVYENTLDTPLGFVNLKDFALRYGFNGGEVFDLKGVLRPLIFVPPSMPLNVLLQKMQAERTHMALVIDEYGGTDGLVTIEDLLETVVGEIEDEHDVDEADSFVEERPGIWLALAKTPVDEFEEATGLTLTAHDEIDEEEVDTLGGLIFMLAGHVPARGEVVRHPDGPEFEVIDADPRRVKRLRVRLPSGDQA